MIQKIFFFSRDVTRSFEAQKVIYQLFAEIWRNFWQNCFFYFLRSKRVMKRFLSKKKWQKVLFLFNSWLNFSQQNFGQKPAQLCIYPRKRKLAWFSFTKLNQHSKSPFHSFLLDFVSFVSKSFPPNSKISTSAFWTNLNQGKNVWWLSFHARLVDIQTSWNLVWRGRDGLNDAQSFLCKKNKTPFLVKTKI